MLLKSVRPLAPWEQGDVAGIIRSSFSDKNGQIKRDVSVYKIDPPDLVRMHAEHQASSGLMDAQTAKWLDVSGILHNAQPDPGNPWFSFLGRVHFNEDMPDDQAVESLVRKLLTAFQKGTLVVTKDQVRAYVRGQKAAADKEWLDFFSKSQFGKKWGKL